MKKSLGFFLFVLLAVQALAIPPRRVAYPMQQADGTTIMVYKFGHDHFAFYATQDGLTLLRDASGNLCYARLENGKAVPTNIMAHEASLRNAEETAFVRDYALRVEDAAAQRMTLRRAAPNRAISASTTDGLGTYGKSGNGAVNSIGNYTIPVLMVQFKDVKFKSTTTAAKMTRFYNTEGYKEESKCVGSVRDYFKSQSNGLFVPTFEIVGTVTLPQNVAYYGGNVTSGPWKDYDKGLCDDNYFVVDAVELAQSQGIDFSKYAVNGRVPLVSILYAGRGEATERSGGEDYLWPCEYDIDQTIGGVHFNSYFVGNELDGDGSLMGMGVFCHEFGHALGLPDFYCTDYNYTDTNPIGEWSIMDMGAYVQDARAPMGYTAYERSYLGWLNIPELKDAEPVTLDSYADLEAGEATPARLLRNPSNNKEYFIFENHQAGTWYPASYGTGMLVMRIAYDKNAWEGNTLNNTKSKQRVKLITANGSNPSPYGSDQKELYSYNSRAVDVASWTLYSGTKLAKPFYSILNKNGKITFNFLEKEFPNHEIGDTITVDGVDYKLVSKSEVTLIANDTKAYAGDMTIPSTIEEENITYTVVGIADGAFTNTTELTTLFIPKSVSTIGEAAFGNTPKLTAINVEAGSRYYRSEDGVLEEHSTAEAVRPTAKGIEEEQVVYDFAANPWNLPVSSNTETKAGELTNPIVVDGISLTATNGSTVTRMWKSSLATDLRVYNGGSLTFTATDGSIIRSISVEAAKWNMSTNTGTLDGTTWTGEAESVTFSASGTCQITKVTLSVERPIGSTAWEVLYYPTARTGAFTLGEDVIAVRAHAFEDAAVEEVTLSANTNSLGEASLSTPSLLKLTVMNPNPDVCNGNPFEKVDKDRCTLVLPEGSENAFRASEYWKPFFVSTGILDPSLVTRRSSTIHDLQGRRVASQQAKGVYIQGGKKLIR